MARKLDDELDNCGCKLDAAAFRDLAREMHAVMHPSWTDEELLYHPDDSKRFCHAVRCRVECLGVPDDLILRTLVNGRKNRRRTVSGGGE